MAAALSSELFIERSEVVTHCGLTFAPLMRSFVYMSEGSGRTVPCRSLRSARTGPYVHAETRSTSSHVCSHGKVASTRARSSQDHSPLAVLSPNRVFLALSGRFRSGLSELCPFQTSLEAPGVLLAPATQPGRPPPPTLLRWLLHVADLAGSGCAVNGSLPGIIILQAHYKGRCGARTSENAKHFLGQEVFH